MGSALKTDEIVLRGLAAAGVQARVLSEPPAMSVLRTAISFVLTITTGLTAVLVVTRDAGEHIGTAGTAIALTLLCTGCLAAFRVARSSKLLLRVGLTVAVAASVFVATGWHQYNFVASGNDGWNLWVDNTGAELLIGDLHPHWLAFGELFFLGTLIVLALDLVARLVSRQLFRASTQRQLDQVEEIIDLR